MRGRHVNDPRKMPQGEHQVNVVTQIKGEKFEVTTTKQEPLRRGGKGACGGVRRLWEGV